MLKIIYNHLKSNYLFYILTLVFTLLLFRNPYSTRTLIPNLEPFPDAMYYTTPQRCFLQGQNWKMCRLHNPEIEGIKTVIPPAYPLVLLPGYILNFDVRSFYFTNIFLALVSLTLLYKVSQNFFKNQQIIGLILFFYISNYFTYWYPTLAMAENLLIPLFLFSILLLQQSKLTIKICMLAGLLAAGFYATKYAYAPLTLTFPIIFIFKIYLSKKNTNEKIYQIILLTIPAGIIMANLVGIPQLLSFLNELLNGAINANSSEVVSSGEGYFSVNYFSKHIKDYSRALIGESQHFLWDTTPLTEKWIALPGILGIFLGLKNDKYILSKIWLVIATISQLLFISTFYVVDIRYVFHFLPILLLGFGFFLQHLQITLLKNKYNFYLFLFVLFMVYLLPNAMRLKSAVMVNLKYSETPWWYLSQLDMNKYFDNIETKSKKPILITLAAPFIADNYSNQTYLSLPLDSQQDFRGTKEDVWGNNDYSDLIKLYKEKIIIGHDVYITNYGVSAAGHFKESYAEIEKSFRLLLIQSGCYNLCNIYRLEIKE